MGLQQFERRLERLVEGAFARAFRGGIQPVEIGRRMAREMDLHRHVGTHGLIVPNVFDVHLAPEDVDRFETFAEALERELAEAVREHARGEGYSFMGPVAVNLVADDERAPGTLAVLVEVRAGPDGAPASIVLPDGRRLPVGERALTLGRLPDCGVVLSDPNVSRRHAEIRREGPDVVILDLGSTNGTRVNGTPTEGQRLSDGDEITVGTTTLRFEAF